MHTMGVDWISLAVVTNRGKSEGGRTVWVGERLDGEGHKSGVSDEFVWSPAVCLPVTPKIH